MQIAGTSCLTCGGHMGTLREGTGCLQCRVTFHRSLATAMLSAWMAVALSTGRDWVRIALVWLTPVFLALELFLGNRALREGFSVWKYCLELVFYGLFAWILTRPAAISFFKGTPENARVRA